MRFGDFQTLCAQTPSYPWCNLFYNQLIKTGHKALLLGVSSDPVSAPVGVNPECGIPRAGQDGSLGNIANIVVCALSFFVTLALVFLTRKRKAAVGRLELASFLALYSLTLPLQLITTGSFLEQGSKALVILTAVHGGLVAATFWSLLGNALVATQVVEDGTLSSLVPFSIFTLAIFALTTYVGLDVGLSITQVIGQSDPASSLHSIPLFVLTSIWPAACFVLYFIIMTYIVLAVLNEMRPMLFYVAAAALFVLSQLDYFLLNKVICRGSSQKVDGSFIATLLETAAVSVLYLAWKSITEESWDEDSYYPT